MHYFEYQHTRRCQSYPEAIDVTRFDTYPSHVAFELTPREVSQQTQQNIGKTALPENDPMAA